MYLSFDKNLIVRNVSTVLVESEGLTSRKANHKYNWEALIGKRLPSDMIQEDDFKIKSPSELRVAVVCNWNDKCGISTYTGYLVKSMMPKVKELRIFSEFTEDQTAEDEDFVDRCWTRGENLRPLADRIKEWSPDFIIIQHEYGIFPNAFRFMQFMEAIERYPYVVAMHSVYKHLDKLVYCEAVRDILVHTSEARGVLKAAGNQSNVHVVPHGCIEVPEKSELWNNMHSPYTIMQFGFGFNYKGVDRALEAIAELKHNDEKFKDISYFYLCSTNSNNEQSNREYYEHLIETAERLDVADNVAIIMKYQSEEMLSLYLRLAKLIVFPYLINGDNEVYGASGAIRVAMAHERPLIASENHLFDDLQGVVPRPSNAQELAKEIDEVFSNDEYRNSIVQRCREYVSENSWSSVADKYLAIHSKIVSRS